MATGSRVDIVKDYPTFFWRYIFLTDSSRAFSVQLSLYHGKGLRSVDDLSCLFFVLWEFFLQDIRDVRHCLVGSDDQCFHDQVDHRWNFYFSRICETFWLRSFFGKRIFLN